MGHSVLGHFARGAQGAARLANEKRARLTLSPSRSGEQQLDKPGSDNEAIRKTPPRLHQPAKGGQVVPAPKAELQTHKAAFREVFGDTLSDEFVDEMLTRLPPSGSGRAAET
jgi:hypothetical protein